MLTHAPGVPNCWYNISWPSLLFHLCPIKPSKVSISLKSSSATILKGHIGSYKVLCTCFFLTVSFYSCHKVASFWTSNIMFCPVLSVSKNVSISQYLCQFNLDLYETLNLTSWGTNLLYQFVLSWWATPQMATIRHGLLQSPNYNEMPLNQPNPLRSL